MARLESLSCIHKKHQGAGESKYKEFQFNAESKVTGGYDSLADYGNSMFSKAKEKLIRGIAKDVAGVLKISPSFAEKADLKDVIDK